MNICITNGCGKPAMGYSRFCNTHKRQKARQGDPLQIPVRAIDLATYRRTVKARIKKNESSTVWQQMEAMWLALVQKAQEHLQQQQAGTPSNRHVAEAWRDLAKVGRQVEPREVIEVILAMYLMQDFAPRRFVSDTAFGYQLVRRVRALAPTAMGVYYDSNAKMTRSVYRDMKARTIEYLARILQQTFGVAGLMVAGLEAKERQEQEAAKQSFFDELNALR